MKRKQAKSSDKSESPTKVRIVDTRTETTVVEPSKDVSEKSKQRKENWKIDDDKALLQALVKYKFAYDQVLNDFKKFQHRRPDETESSLEKRWKNIKANSTYAEKATFVRKEFVQKKKKITEMELDSQRAIHQEIQASRESMFNTCKECFSKLISSEILARSSEPKNAVEVEDVLVTEETKRRNIREQSILNQFNLFHH
jgi:hypothetical protein